MVDIVLNPVLGYCPQEQQVTAGDRMEIWSFRVIAWGNWRDRPAINKRVEGGRYPPRKPVLPLYLSGIVAQNARR